MAELNHRDAEDAEVFCAFLCALGVWGGSALEGGQHRLAEDPWQEVELRAVRVAIAAAVASDEEAPCLVDPAEGMGVARGAGGRAKVVRRGRTRLAGRRTYRNGAGLDRRGFGAKLGQEERSDLFGRCIARRRDRGVGQVEGRAAA